MQNGDHCFKREFNFQNPSLPFSRKKKKKKIIPETKDEIQLPKPSHSVPFTSPE